jgi:hypothetical protein
VRASEETNAGLRVELQSAHEAFEGAKAEVRRCGHSERRAPFIRSSLFPLTKLLRQTSFNLLSASDDGKGAGHLLHQMMYACIVLPPDLFG